MKKFNLICICGLFFTLISASAQQAQQFEYKTPVESKSVIHKITVNEDKNCITIYVKKPSDYFYYINPVVQKMYTYGIVSYFADRFSSDHRSFHDSDDKVFLGEQHLDHCHAVMSSAVEGSDLAYFIKQIDVLLSDDSVSSLKSDIISKWDDYHK